jgi:Cofilin/tropomyosin-type actin-binding protein
MTILAGTMQTDPRSGGIKRSSGVNVMPAIAEGKNFLLLTLTPLTWLTSSLAHCFLFYVHCIYLDVMNTHVAWAEVRDNNNPNVDWIIAGYDNGSKTDITVLQKGSGGVSACAAALLDSEPVFGGFRLSNGRFRHFYYAPDSASVMKKGRASMHKNGVLNVMEGCDGEINMQPGLTESDIV